MSDELDDKSPGAAKPIEVSLEDIDTSPDRAHEPNSFDDTKYLVQRQKRGPDKAKQIARAARRGRLKAELGMPLDVLLDAMRDAHNAKVQHFRVYAPDGSWLGLTTDQRRLLMELNTLAVEFATRAAPYLHAKLAPHVPKGSGQVVALIIEDA